LDTGGPSVEKRFEMMTLNRQQFARLVAGTHGFARLEGEVGTERAFAVAELLFQRNILDTSEDGRYVMVPRTEIGKFTTLMDEALVIECRQIAAKRVYAGELLQRAIEGKLGFLLKEAAEPLPDLPPTPGGKPRGRRETTILAASDWICRSMHTDLWETVAKLLAEHSTGPSSDVLGKTPETLDRIHAALCPHAPGTRMPNPEVSYPSSVGGRHLLETIFEWTAEAEWPLPGDEAWLDVALFYLGAIGTVQGYPDGNKRIARMAYTITLLRGRRPFLAPNAELEEQLIRMKTPV